jgi:hypothetical protein
MARTILAKTTEPGSYAYSGALATFAAADVANGNQFAMSGGERVLVWNTSADTAYVASLTSAADSLGRTKDISESVAFGTVRIFGPFQTPGWKQTDGYFYLSGANAALKFAVLTPPV